MSQQQLTNRFDLSPELQAALRSIYDVTGLDLDRVEGTYVSVFQNVVEKHLYVDHDQLTPNASLILRSIWQIVEDIEGDAIILSWWNRNKYIRYVATDMAFMRGLGAEAYVTMRNEMINHMHIQFTNDVWQLHDVHGFKFHVQK